MDTKAGKLVGRRAIDWMKKKFPKVLVGGIISMGATV